MAPKKKNPLKQLLKQVPTPEEYQIAWQSVRKDEPRTAVILAATLVEDMLRALLIAHMAKGADEKDGPKDLFGPMGPLRSFDAKIRLGYAMKIYGDRTFHDLDLLREVRNVFAHGKLSISFSTPGIKWAVDSFICHDRGKDNPQKRFYSVTTILLSHLMLRRKDPTQGVQGLD
jgi:DNA-binding MltR family transcriptional regulator